MQPFNVTQKKPPARKPTHSGRREVSMSVVRGGSSYFPLASAGSDYLIANRKLPTRRIGGRVLVPVTDLRKYARGDHPEPIVA